MTNREKLVSILTIDELHLAFCKRNYDPHIGCLNCQIYTPGRACKKVDMDCGTFVEWLNKEAEE